MQNKIKFEVCGQPGNADAYREIEEFIWKMQKIMRIQDWDIELRFLSGEETYESFGDVNAMAFIRWELSHKYACLNVNCEHDRVKGHDVEEIIIHELCHLAGAQLSETIQAFIQEESKCNIADGLMEQMNENYAKAIWNAYCNAD